MYIVHIVVSKMRISEDSYPPEDYLADRVFRLILAYNSAHESLHVYVSFQRYAGAPL